MNTPSLDLNHRQFTSPGQGYWPDATPEQWNSWQWQMQHSVKSLAQLEGKIELTSEEHAGVLLANTKLAMGITPYFFNLIDPFDPDCPIRRQVIPRIEEMTYEPTDLADPCGEDHDMPVPGLVHR
jgi:lysine 2,3-aminomutase